MMLLRMVSLLIDHSRSQVIRLLLRLFLFLPTTLSAFLLWLL